MKINVQAIFVVSLVLLVVIISYCNIINIHMLIDFYHKSTHELSNTLSYELNNMTSYELVVGIYVVSYIYVTSTIYYYIEFVYRKPNKKRVYAK